MSTSNNNLTGSGCQVRSELPSKVRAARAASLDAARSDYVSEHVQPSPQGLYTASQWRYKGAVERAAMSSLDICTYSGNVVSARENEARAVLFPGGLVVHGRYESGRQQGGGRRGVVSGKSRQSRRRQLELMMKVRPDGPGFFMTATLPDAVLAIADSSQGVVDELKRKGGWLDKLLDRVFYRFPGATVLWAVEFKRRLSGQFVGQVMPHIHMIVFGVEPGALPLDGHLLASDEGKSDDALRLQGWLKETWAAIVGSGDEKHERRGADVVELDSRRKVFTYVAKYTGKEWGAVVDTVTGEVIHTGRMWGIAHGRAAKDASGQPYVMHPGVAVGIADDEMASVKRLVKRWLKARGRGAANYAAWLVSPGAYKKRFTVFGFLGLDDLVGAGLYGGDDKAAILRFFDVLGMCAPIEGG